MTRNVFFDVTKETVGKVAEEIINKNEDSVLVLAPISGSASTYAPSTKGKNKGYFRMKFEVWIPEDAIKGENALNDFGIVTMMRLPKNRVADHLIRKKIIKPINEVIYEGGYVGECEYKKKVDSNWRCCSHW